jgi:hypothetical protein
VSYCFSDNTWNKRKKIVLKFATSEMLLKIVLLSTVLVVSSTWSKENVVSSEEKIGENVETLEASNEFLGEVLFLGDEPETRNGRDQIPHGPDTNCTVLEKKWGSWRQIRLPHAYDW